MKKQFKKLIKSHRNEYLKDWSSAFKNAKFESFTFIEENTRIFGDFGLIRATTVYTKRTITDL